MQTKNINARPDVGCILNKIAIYGSRCGGYIMLITAIIISVDVIIRKLFSVTLLGAAEISGFAFAISAAWSFGFAVLKKAHVRVDVAYRLTPISIKAFLDVFSMLALTAVSLLIAWFVASLLVESVELGSESALLRIPLWIPHLFCCLGLVLFSFTTIYLAIRTLIFLIRRRYEEVNLEAGVIND